ncbi:uncharacterized protein T551_01010 [Pneumocystis jirovecii RU7]|uniref:SWR1-complex protein 5 n=1 Tax=Pneumocystis jirovecii (strain RU7) TaxID=1408657 RepID=A0A0W4ZTN7_PNEJ7|nr:uncharacterized protein T551_01010 [Pneumocystis jirovecii RU7]KTW31749.1 hypothetical protein T551_01010 [Pneumocystis jirovecii RU7]
MSPVIIKKLIKNSDVSDNESSDEDFVLHGSNGDCDSELDKNISDVSYDSGDEKVINSLKRKKSNDNFSEKNCNCGVRTRSQSSLNKKVVEWVPEAPQIDVNAIWNTMNEKRTVKEIDYNFFSPPEEKIKISRTYEFAGKVETEEKFVLKDSAEAKVHFSSINLVQTSKPPLRRPTKRVSSLEASNNKTVKLNTLEKSRLDWAKFVDKEGISEELKNASKDGYIDKQLFLQVTEERMIKNIKEKMKK